MNFIYVFKKLKLNGKGHTISYLYLDNNNIIDAGLFGYTSGPIKIDSLGLKNTYIFSKRYIGALIGRIYCRGGVAEINHVFAVSSIINGQINIGGLIGDAENTNITNSFTYGGTINGEENVGGIIGFSDSRNNIENCFSADSVNGQNLVGGIIGKMNYGTITNSYAMGKVNGNTNVGGVVGSIVSSNYDEYNSYWDTTATGVITSACGTGIGIHDFKKHSYFEQWDFDSTWHLGIFDGDSVIRPQLIWYEYEPVFSIRYEGNGNDSGESFYDDSLYFSGGIAVIHNNNNNFKKTGYIFNSWNTREDGSGESFNSEDNIVILSDTILFAQWDTIYYSISYINIGSEINHNPNYYTVEDEITLLEPTDSLGYLFVGWFTDESFNDPISIPAIPKGSIGDTTFYAKWSIINYKISYINVGSKLNTNPQYYTVEDEITLIEPNDSIGYLFNGWFIDESLNDTVSIPAIQIGSAGDTTFYAKWSVETGTINFDDLNILVYPNPVYNYLIIESDELCLIKIFDLNGKEVIRKEMEDTVEELNLNTLETGTYVLLLRIDSRTIRKKILKI